MGVVSIVSASGETTPFLQQGSGPGLHEEQHSGWNGRASWKRGHVTGGVPCEAQWQAAMWHGHWSYLPRSLDREAQHCPPKDSPGPPRSSHVEEALGTVAVTLKAMNGQTQHFPHQKPMFHVDDSSPGRARCTVTTQVPP